MVLLFTVAVKGTSFPEALSSLNTIKEAALLLLRSESSTNRTASLKVRVGFTVADTFTAPLAGTKTVVGAVVSGAADGWPSKVKLSKRLLPTVPPEPCMNSTFSLKFGLLSVVGIAVKSSVAKAGSPLLGVILVKKV